MLRYFIPRVARLPRRRCQPPLIAAVYDAAGASEAAARSFTARHVAEPPSKSHADMIAARPHVARTRLQQRRQHPEVGRQKPAAAPRVIEVRRMPPNGTDRGGYQWRSQRHIAPQRDAFCRQRRCTPWWRDLQRFLPVRCRTVTFVFATPKPHRPERQDDIAYRARSAVPRCASRQITRASGAVRAARRRRAQVPSDAASSAMTGRAQAAGRAAMAVQQRSARRARKAKAQR